MSQIINIINKNYSIMVADSRVSNTTNGYVFSDITDKLSKISENVIIGFIGNYSFASNVINSISTSLSAQFCDSSSEFISSYCRKYSLGANSSFITSGIDTNGKICSYIIKCSDDFIPIRKDAKEDVTMIETSLIGAVPSRQLLCNVIKSGFDFRSPAEAIKCGKRYIQMSSNLHWTINNICTFRIIEKDNCN